MSKQLVTADYKGTVYVREGSLYFQDDPESLLEQNVNIDLGIYSDDFVEFWDGKVRA